MNEDLLKLYESAAKGVLSELDEVADVLTCALCGRRFYDERDFDEHVAAEEPT